MCFSVTSCLSPLFLLRSLIHEIYGVVKQKIHKNYGLKSSIHNANGLVMKSTEFFRNALKFTLERRKDLSQKGFAEMLEVDPKQVNDYLHGRVNWSEKFREKAAEALGVDYLRMLFIGRSIMDNSPASPFKSSEEQPFLVRTNSDAARDYIEKHPENYHGVPLYESGRLAAFVGGQSFIEYEEPESTVIVYQPELGGRVNHRLCAAKIGGNSMSPVIPEGSIVVVDLDDTEQVDGRIYALLNPDSEPPEAVVKRAYKTIQKKFKGFALVSINNRYAPIMTDFDWPEIVIGRIVWMWRSLEVESEW